tara:strand:- start:1 stop:456 length:456 start_codon:yes stop_codon:yes gene_type:complete
MTKKTAKNPKGAGRKKLIIDYKKLDEIGGKGLSEAQIASVLGISWHTLRNRKRDSLNFSKALEKAKAKDILEVSNALFINATEKNNVQAQQFFLRNRSENWKADDVIEHKISLKDVLNDAKGRIIDIKPTNQASSGLVPYKNRDPKKLTSK